MRQLKGWDIDLKILKKFNKNIFYKLDYILIPSFFMLISFLTLFFAKLNALQIISATIVFFLSITLITLYFYKKRIAEIKLIKEIIEYIRKNKFSSSNEIKLPNSLSELESEIKKMYDKMISDIAHLKKLEQIRTEFLGNVSHELRTPIFAIQGYIETLLNGAIEDEKVNRTFLQKANQHVINLNNLLNDLIDISMIESKQMKMSLRFFKIAPFLESVVNEFIPYAEKKNIELKLLPIDSNIEVFGDKERLRQVMNNLITNAIKYTEKGSVEVGIIEYDKNVRIFVKDTGIGIPEKDLERIFERFYRVDKNRSREMGGTGLGLAIVKHIIEAHNSKVEVKSQLGKGSEFSFLLKKI
ncbi:MAG: ATP-binding protein [Melioribacter sp.]|nr:ATP-binding protein [Melioribacter sp.]